MPIELDDRQAVKKRQYELSEDDVATLGKGAHSKEAWLAVAMRHGFDPDTREDLPPAVYSDTRSPKLIRKAPQAFLATPKNWDLENTLKVQEQVRAGGKIPQRTTQVNEDMGIAQVIPGGETEEEFDL